ncbi:hypothetical protein LTR05_007937 [Lithohypha guttulata]|uniref:SnoaL-like domain-containing protein n=1 Tax=Lithohypha guttulata TaxID=1690604 RepID=A0AAN7STI5_9EURO|nr:hypothetical protein LTR05_007937 [Lithohypha guttulata]
MSDQQRKHLLASAESFCNDIASQADLETILSHFSTSYTPVALEHGHKQLAPFLGRPFLGIDGIKEYFGLLGKCLKHENMGFKNYIVDTSEDRSTGQSWNEIFTYQLAFDTQGKVISYHIWADSGAAYLASKGLLDEDDLENVAVTAETRPA